jgi:hypothetical protein
VYRIVVAFLVFGGLLAMGYALVKLADLRIAIFHWMEREAADPFHTKRRANRRANGN